MVYINGFLVKYHKRLPIDVKIRSIAVPLSLDRNNPGVYISITWLSKFAFHISLLRGWWKEGSFCHWVFVYFTPVVQIAGEKTSSWICENEVWCANYLVLFTSKYAIFLRVNDIFRSSESWEKKGGVFSQEALGTVKRTNAKQTGKFPKLLRSF